MYSYTWDIETGGYILDTKITGVIKEIRPVYKEELRLLGFDKKFGWKIPEVDGPLMWSEAHKYYYFGECVGEAIGGGLYDMPNIKSDFMNLEIHPVNVEIMIEKNQELMNGLVQKTLGFIYNAYKEYQRKVGIFYVAFSGGKDSIVMLDLVQRALPHDGFVVIFGNTSMELNETLRTYEMAKERWNTLDWYEAKADFDATESWEKIGHPARKLRWCCSVHKTAPSVLKVKEIYEKKYKNEGKKAPFKVMVFDGIRAEESDARATYSMISEGNKHAVQFNCSPIFEWNTSELFIYMLQYNLMINNVYKQGSSRVGCKLCPMASNWYECIINHSYPSETEPLLNILYSSIKKEFVSNDDRKKYFQDGGWKSRVGGRELSIGGNKVTEINNDGRIKILIKNGNYRWDKWMSTIGDVFEIEPGQYSLTYKDVTLFFTVIEETSVTIIELEPILKTKSSIRFMYLFKNAIHKAAYCVNCKECMAECSFGALNITNDNIEIKKCKHCESCLDSSKGCIVARSLGISGGGNNMSIKNISRYQNFGFRKEWLDLYFELLDNFWVNERMGKYMLVGFRTWLKESGITNSNALTADGEILKKLGSDSVLTWAYIFNNLAYESPIVNWYVKAIEFDRVYQSNDLNILIGDGYSPTTIKNALSSLKETLRLSPIGINLGQGECEMKGRTVNSVIKHGWSNPEPVAILYALFKYAENSNGLYSFTLSDLFDFESERDGISPVQLYNLKKENCKEIIELLARDYPEYIRVNFNKDMMEDIYLESKIDATEIVKIFF